MAKKELGGWLLFFFILNILSLIALFSEVIYIITLTYEVPLLLVTLGVNIFLLYIISRMVYEIYKKDKAVMKTLPIYFNANIVAAVVGFFVNSIVYEDYSGLGTLIGVVIFVAIWRHYFSETKRVKQTFGVNLK